MIGHPDPAPDQDGAVRQVADGIEFPNCMAVTPDNATLIVSEPLAFRLTAYDIAAARRGYTATTPG